MYVTGTSLAHKVGYDMKIMYKGKALRCDRPLHAAEAPWIGHHNLVRFAQMHGTNRGGLYH